MSFQVYIILCSKMVTLKKPLTWRDSDLKSCGGTSETSCLLGLGQSYCFCLLFRITFLCWHRIDYPLEATLAGGIRQASFCFPNIKFWLLFQENLTGKNNPPVLVLCNQGQFVCIPWMWQNSFFSWVKHQWISQLPSSSDRLNCTPIGSHGLIQTSKNTV